jgi:chorismate synthase
VSEIGGDAIDMANFDAAEIGNNPFFCPDAAAAGAGKSSSMTRAGRIVRSARWSNASPPACRPGWGAPLYGKLDADLAAAMMGINAVKGVEIGDGFAAARLTGEQQCRSDAARKRNAPVFLANHAGGIAGGISTGQPVVVRVAFKPTSSILTPVETDDREGEATEIVHQGPPRSLRRHSRRAGGRGDDGAGAGRSQAAAPRHTGRWPLARGSEGHASWQWPRSHRSRQ